MTSLSDEQRALLSLTLISGIGPRLMNALLERFGSAQNALRASQEQLRQIPHMKEKTAEQFQQALAGVEVERELERMNRFDVGVIFRGEPSYPENLETISSAPNLLYLRGALSPDDKRSIAIVGSRRCTSYGTRIAERLAADLARCGWTVVSGLARGIDGAAHRGALKAGGRTIAVLAGGLSSIYPPEHKNLSVEVEKAGALLTEFNMQMEPLPVLFPMRNRIISGISLAVVVVEANAKSGALLTTNHALEQNREVFAVPGQVDSTASEGTLELLRKGAKLVRNVDDILEDLQGVTPPSSRVQGRSSAATKSTPAAPVRTGPPPGLDETQKRIWDYLADQARHQDEIIQHLGITAAALSSILLTLEMKRVIRRLPGNRYERY